VHVSTHQASSYGLAAAAGEPFPQDFSASLSTRVMEMKSKEQKSSSKTRMTRDLYKYYLFR